MSWLVTDGTDFALLFAVQSLSFMVDVAMSLFTCVSFKACKSMAVACTLFCIASFSGLLEELSLQCFPISLTEGFAFFFPF